MQYLDRTINGVIVKRTNQNAMAFSLKSLNALELMMIASHLVPYKPPISPNLSKTNFLLNEKDHEKSPKNVGTRKENNKEDKDDSIGASWPSVSRRPNSPNDEKETAGE